ncbi:hypothetical protein A7982_12823 [Minicystis rosea]|nr:hypothetical protein A7982_12823 [Minicystis rosea]
MFHGRHDRQGRRSGRLSPGRPSVSTEGGPVSGARARRGIRRAGAMARGQPVARRGRAHPRSRWSPRRPRQRCRLQDRGHPGQPRQGPLQPRERRPQAW